MMKTTLAWVVSILTLAAPAWAASQEPLKIGVAAMISPKDTVRYYGKMIQYVGKKLGKPVEMVQRENYDEMDALLEKGDVPVAFICSGPYVKDKAKFDVELLVAPQSYGQPFYYAYILVAKNSSYKSMADLRQKRFAFTDPKSNTGKLVPTYMVAKEFNATPEEFFGEIIYTKSHDKSIEMVAKGLADGSSVDSLIYDYAAKKNPVYTSMTRVLVKSPPYGIPPVVVTKKTHIALKKKLKDIFLGMHNDPEGREILGGIMVDKFIVPRDSDYDTVRDMVDWLAKAKK